jgi:hypothetical protein
VFHGFHRAFYDRVVARADAVDVAAVVTAFAHAVALALGRDHHRVMGEPI